VNRMSFLRRWFYRAFLLCALLGLSACRVEIGKDPNPRPTPTPTPTPTPAAAETFALSAEPLSALPERSVSARVANASAEYFENATAVAVEETASVRRALTRAAGAPAEAQERLREAQKSLAHAANAYRKAETAVFLVDPASVEELRAQPDPLRAGTPGQRDEGMEQLSASLEKMNKILSRPLDKAKASALLAEADYVGVRIEKLEQGLRGMADAWREEDTSNFRAKFFLSSSNQAVARVFQGLLAVSGDTLPALLGGDHANSSEVFGRVQAMQEIYLGGADGEADSSSVHSLVEQASPVQSALTRAAIARAVALAGVVDLSPGDGNYRQQLRSALLDVTRQLTFAAQALGIVVVDSEG